MEAKAKPIPSFPSDAAAKEFVATANLAHYDLSGFKPMRFDLGGPELKPADVARNLDAEVTSLSPRPPVGDVTSQSTAKQGQ